MTNIIKQALIDSDYFKDNRRDCNCLSIIAHDVKNAGGTAYLVGGWVRDRINGKCPKDMDIEIHGVVPSKIQEILRNAGNCEVMKKGASFGVYGLKNYDFDIAMPRTEHSIGVKHTDFEVSVDPFMGVEMASMRRDFTINALMYDIIADEIVDCHGGMNDMKDGIIRHVNDTTYVEDALRVFRAAQFAARFNFRIADETIELSRTISGLLPMLSAERVYEELKKALLKADKPSIFFEQLDRMNALEYWFPELYALKTTEQEHTHHPEGNAFVHTMMVIDEAAKVRSQVENKFAFMVAALCHDFGKTVTTEFNQVKQKYTSYGHDVKGVPLAEEFMNRLRFSNNDKKYVLNMVELHMRPNMLAKATKKASKFNKLFDIALVPEDLLRLAKADSNGRAIDNDYSIIDDTLQKRLNDYYSLMDKPQVTARDLLENGVTPGPVMGNMLKRAHDLHLSGIRKEIALKTVLKENRSDAGLNDMSIKNFK